MRDDSKEDRPRKRRPVYDDDADPPRRRSRPKRKRGTGTPFWVKGIVGAAFFVVSAVGGFFAVQALLGSARDVIPLPVAGVGDLEKQVLGGTQYVPHVSEKKFEEFLKGREPGEVTEEQVYAIMGEPTRRDLPVTVRKNGQVFIAYTAHWEVPGSGIVTRITFSNGRVGGMILGLKITEGEAGNRN
jgi:hypothetical protein